MALLQVFQAKLLQAAEGGALTVEAVKDLRAAMDFTLMATKRAAQAVGKAMGFMIVLQRHLWLNLADLKDADRKVLLKAPVTPSGLFGDAVESITERMTLACRWLLSRCPDGLNRGGECERGPAPKRQKFTFKCEVHIFKCEVHIFKCKMHTFSQIRALSSLSKYGAACPTSEQCTAVTSYSRASNDQAAMSVHKRLGSYSGNLALATQRDRARIYSSIQMQTTPFQWRGEVSNIASMPRF